MREIFAKRKSEILSTPLGNVLDTNLATKHDMKRGQTIQNNTFRNNAFLAKMRKKRRKKTKSVHCKLVGPSKKNNFEIILKNILL